MPWVSSGARLGGRTRAQVALVGIGSLLTVALVAAAGLVAVASWQLDQFERISADELQLIAAPEGSPENFLVIGSDSRASVDADDEDAGFLISEATGGQRADSMMIMRVYPDGDRLSLLSIPRDLWVPIPEVGGTAIERTNRINVAYHGGPQQVVDTLAHNFGIQIHHYVEVDFGGFKEIVDAVDGVPMYFDAPARDSGSGLSIDSAGCHVLEGTEALAFVRSRKLQVLSGGEWVADPTGDLGRIERQQDFLRSALARVMGLDYLSDLPELRRVIAAGTDSVVLDAGLGVGQLVSIGQRMGEFSDHSIDTHSLPTTAFRGPRGESALELVEVDAVPILAVFGGSVDGVAPTGVEDNTVSRDVSVAGVSTSVPAPAEVRVLNGSGLEGHAGNVAARLVDLGFDVVQVGDASESVTSTVVRHGRSVGARAEVLAGHLVDDVEVSEDRGLADDEIVVTVAAALGAIREASEPTAPPPATGQSGPEPVVATTAPVTAESAPQTTLARVGLQAAGTPAAAECG